MFQRSTTQSEDSEVRLPEATACVDGDGVSMGQNLGDFTSNWK